MTERSPLSAPSLQAEARDERRRAAGRLLHRVRGLRLEGRVDRLLALVLVLAGPGLVTLLAFTTVGSLAPALLYLLATAVAAWAGGLWPGIAAGVLSFLGLNYFFMQPHQAFGFTSAADVVGGAFLVLTPLGVTQMLARQERARAAAQAAAERSRRLQRAADALSAAVAPDQVLEAVMTEGVRAAEARAGLIAVVTDDGKDLQVIAQRGYEDRVVAPWRRFPLEDELPLSQAVRTGEPVFLSSQAERDRRFPALASLTGPTHGLVCLPLIVEGRRIGGLTFSFSTDQDFDEDRRSLKMALAHQAAQALDRARLYENARATGTRLAVLARASEILSSSLDYESTLERLVRIAVPALADWCTIDIVDEDGKLQRLAVAHQDPAKVDWARELEERYPPDPDAPTGTANVIRTGEAELLPEIPQELLEAAAGNDPELDEIIEELGLRSWICVPLKARGQTIGALSLVTSESGRTYGEADLELALDLASRAGAAVDNARLYRESERRGEAARALRYVGDAVILVDELGTIRYWNPAAAQLTGRSADEATGQPIEAVVHGWKAAAGQVEPAEAGAGRRAASATVPLPLPDGERWVSAAAVDFGEGVVYALRDVSEEYALEQARADFVATASHELRTPLAAVYGAARTLLRKDLDIGPENRDVFLSMIEDEAARLTDIVNQILLAGELAGGNLRTEPTTCDLRALVEQAMETTRLGASETVRLVPVSGASPPARCDEDRLRQVVLNLLDNAVKYSPDGGDVKVELTAADGLARLTVRDEGLGIPGGEHERIFERFYRLDPTLTRGVGGSGLGLYISRELVRRMGGSLTVESELGRGSAFTVELPLD